MPASRTIVLGATLLGTVVGFVLAALLHAYPKDVVARHRYCQLCGTYEETYDEGVVLGGEHRRAHAMGGPIHDLLGPQVGEHTHEFTAWATVFPTFGIDPEHPEVATRVRELEQLQRSAAGVSALALAMRDDPTRTTNLLQHALDPDRPYPSQAVLALQRAVDRALERAGERDPERWTAVDAALEAGG
jgi:hypothetical protein